MIGNPVQSKMQLFHVIWVTYNSKIAKGNLPDYYELFDKNNIAHTVSNPFLEQQNVNSSVPSVVLNEEAIGALKEDILDITKEDGDRIAGNLKIVSININSNTVSLLLYAEEATLDQKLARLKSRTSTLLSFKFPKQFNGKGTWKKGVYKLRVLDSQQDLAISIIKNSGF